MSKLIDLRDYLEAVESTAARIMRETQAGSVDWMVAAGRHRVADTALGLLDREGEV